MGACKGNHRELINFMLTQIEKNPNQRATPDSPTYFENRWNICLRGAASGNHLDLVKEMINRGATGFKQALELVVLNSRFESFTEQQKMMDIFRLLFGNLNEKLPNEVISRIVWMGHDYLMDVLDEFQIDYAENYDFKLNCINNWFIFKKLLRKNCAYAKDKKRKKERKRVFDSASNVLLRFKREQIAYTLLIYQKFRYTSEVRYLQRHSKLHILYYLKNRHLFDNRARYAKNKHLLQKNKIATRNTHTVRTITSLFACGDVATFDARFVAFYEPGYTSDNKDNE